jgi:hypothetical protein
MATQIVFDLRHGDPLKQTSDWWSFGARGAGGRAAQSRVLGRTVEIQEKWFQELRRWAAELAPDQKKLRSGCLHNQDPQSAFHESARYRTLRRGQRTPWRYS